EDDLPTRRSARRVPMPARRAGPPAGRRPGPSRGRSRLPVDATGPTDVIEPPAVDEVAEVVKAPVAPPSKRKRWAGRQIAGLAGYVVLGLVSLLVLGLSGYAWSQFRVLNTVHKSNAIAAPSEKKSLNGDTNILIM